MAVLGASGKPSGGSLYTQLFTASGAFSPAFDCKALVYVIGGGGGGGAAGTYSVAGYKGAASGGAAGGCAISLLDLKKATTYNIVIGAGGAQTAATSVNQSNAGNAGTNTTFTDASGVVSTMTGNGRSRGSNSFLRNR